MVFFGIATLEIFDLINAIFASAIIRRIIGADNCHEAMATMSNCFAKKFSVRIWRCKVKPN